jgi:hypothetical protein
MEHDDDMPLFTFRRPTGIEADFLGFHREHPEVYDLLVRLAREWVSLTGRRLGIQALVERARWEHYIKKDEGKFKLNNSHCAFYARLIMEREPDLKGLFELRVQLSKFRREGAA